MGYFRREGFSTVKWSCQVNPTSYKAGYGWVEAATYTWFSHRKNCYSFIGKILLNRDYAVFLWEQRKYIAKNILLRMSNRSKSFKMAFNTPVLWALKLMRHFYGHFFIYCLIKQNFWQPTRTLNFRLSILVSTWLIKSGLYLILMAFLI